MPSEVVFLLLLAFSYLGYLLGHRDGYRKGRESGYVSGHFAGQQRWIKAMEARRGPDGKDAFLGVVRDR